MLIYRITNQVNGKVYIGKTTLTAQARWKRHVFLARFERGCPYLGAAIRAHGIEGFKVDVLYHAKTAHELNMMERFFIVLHQSHLRDNGYNLTLGGDGGILCHTQATKDKIASGRQGVNHPMYGRHHSEEAKRAISEHNGLGFLGKRHALNSRLRMGARGEDHPNFGKSLSESTKQKIRGVNAKTYVLESPIGDLVVVTDLKDFCRRNNLHYPKMCETANGKRFYRGWTQGVRT